MKRIILILLAAVLACGVAGAQDFPMPIFGETANCKIITCHIATTTTGDITIPMFVAPCQGYIATLPRMSTTSGSAAADTSYVKHWEFYVVAFDTIATAVPDTIARYVTFDTTLYGRHSCATGTYRVTRRMTALYNYTFGWCTPTVAAKVIQKHDVIALRCESEGTTPVAVTDLDVTFVFVPYYFNSFLPN